MFVRQVVKLTLGVCKPRGRYGAGEAKMNRNENAEDLLETERNGVERGETSVLEGRGRMTQGPYHDEGGEPGVKKMVTCVQAAIEGDPRELRDGREGSTEDV